MHCIVALLYVVGFLMLALSVLMIGPISNRAIRKTQEQGKGLLPGMHSEINRRTAELDREGMDEGDYYGEISRIKQEAQTAVFERAREIDVPLVLGIADGGDSSAEIASAIRHVGRANKPTAIVALIGGLISTVASVWSIYV